MVDATHTSFTASDRSYYAIIKKEAHAIAVNAGFSEKRIAELDIILAELTSNLHKYADGGEVLISYNQNTDNDYIEMVTIDDGPGMADVVKMSADGYSSTNTIGHGLGSIKRLADDFDIYSQKGWGTILLCRVYKDEMPLRKAEKKFEVRAIVVAKQGERTSGDGFYHKQTPTQVKILLADGLGHGPEANLAVNEAVKSFKVCSFDSPVEIIRDMHGDVRKTRGLVGTVIVYDLVANSFKVAGVGNISTKLLGAAGAKTLLSYNGIIGHNVPNTMNDHSITAADFNHIIMCSDGIRSNWSTTKYPGIQQCDLSIQAAAIYKDFKRNTDDMSVVVIKVKAK